MENKNESILKYIQLWSRIQSLLDTHIHYLESATYQSDHIAKHKRPPIKNIHTFNIIIVSLKKAMEGHYGALLRHDLNNRELEENQPGIPDDQIFHLIDQFDMENPSSFLSPTTLPDES